MSDIAARVGVSQALVSLVFRNQPGASPQTRERIFQAADELGYRPDAAAQLLRRTRSRQLGVLFTMRHPHDVDIVEAIYPAAEKHGYNVALSAMAVARDERQAVDELLALRSEAILIIGAASRPSDLTSIVGQTPVVEINPRTRADGADAVRTADSKGVRQAVDHLAELGHRSIAHVDGGTMPGASERRRGYRTSMRRRGLAGHIQILAGDYTEESGARAARELLAQDHLPTAVIAGNDRCAHGLLTTFLRAGLRVPEDVSVIGYDDSQLARLSFIDLTSVRQGAADVAELAVQAAAERLDEGRTTDRDIVLEPTLVVRGSTGHPHPR
ncbi:LacI family DNA-binding transcriptional regulator [Saccharopolyspora mangrovi]|uniref:LacI family DNA-binding transcriptional regulator n=1 Tax=Saccharopolyspora mangrovi TaxID=3082379 RepID=A0ABU6ALJ8_9PSEU|nr:LacI family DNA-binding transcriptional regulator [Saccharopolyspora sp. S2-29]MEB3372429.1 LacI family DNA-binding transcriptional regulator [Saccharopolyspora sp. S2-29]